MKKAILVLLAALMVSGCSTSKPDPVVSEKQETTQSTEISEVVESSEEVSETIEEVVEETVYSIEQDALAILTNQKSFFLEDKEVKLEDLQVEGNSIAYVDFDADGIDEALILTSNPTGEYLVLHHKDEKMLGYTVGYRALNEIKKDGTFLSSNGASSYSINRFEFTEDQLSFIELAKADNDELTIGEDKVSKKDFDDFMDYWNKLEAVHFIENSMK